MTKKKIPVRKKVSWPMPRTHQDRKRVISKNEKPSLTEQSHATGCDLKLIMERYTQTGEIPLGNTRGQAEFMDCPDQDQDFSEMQQTLARYRSQYELLPDQVKSQFKDAQDFMSYLITQENQKLEQDQQEEEIIPPADSEAVAEGAEGTSEASKNV